MAAYNFHREIMEEPANVTQAAEFCMSQCDPIKNPTGNCISFCSLVCPPICNTSDSSPLPQSSSPPPPPTGSYIISLSPKPHHSSLSLPLKISLVILVLTFSLFLLYTLYKFYTVWYRSRRRRSPPSPENQETHDEFLDHDVLDHPIWYIRTTGLQPSVINAIKVVNFSKTDGIVEGTCCSVCLSEFEEEDTLRLLPNCKHAFHISCIDTWLRSHTNCPLCRAGIADNSVETPSPEQNTDGLGFTGETHLGISTTRDDDRGEASGSSGLRIGEADEEHLNTTSPKRQGL